MQMSEAIGYAMAASGIEPVIDKIFPFDEAQAAYRHMPRERIWQNRYPRSMSWISLWTPRFFR